MDGNSEHLSWQNDPFREDFTAVPYEEELRERARIVLEHNEDALRLHVEILLEELSDRPQLRKEIVIPILCFLEEIKLSWIAEACFLDIRQVCEIEEGYAIMTFNCLLCGEELATNDQRPIRLHRTTKDFLLYGSETHLEALLCEACAEQKAQDEEDQQLLEDIHRQAQLNALRNSVTYEDRRMTSFWTRRIRAIVHRRAGYKCQLCGRSDGLLDVHHNNYDNYGQEKLEDLVVLCRSCHSDFHRRQGKGLPDTAASQSASTLIEPGFIRAPAFPAHLPPGTCIHSFEPIVGHTS